MVRHVSDRIAILYLGRLVETGPTHDVFANPKHPYTQSLIASEPQPDPRKRRASLAITGEIPSVLARPSGCEFHTRCAFAQTRCKTVAPTLQHMAESRAVRCHYTGNLQPKTGGNHVNTMEN
jgi:peptide/nickel transport system ATP-binding protein